MPCSSTYGKLLHKVSTFSEHECGYCIKMFIASPVWFCNEELSFPHEILPESKPLFSKLCMSFFFFLQICCLLLCSPENVARSPEALSPWAVYGVEDSTNFSIELLDFGTVRNTAVNFPALCQAFLQNKKFRTFLFLQVCVKFGCWKGCLQRQL